VDIHSNISFSAVERTLFSQAALLRFSGAAAPRSQGAVAPAVRKHCGSFALLFCSESISPKRLEFARCTWLPQAAGKAMKLMFQCMKSLIFLRHTFVIIQ
jgi:hypothetical protein